MHARIRLLLSLYCFALLTLGLAVSGSAHASINDGLVLHYSFDTNEDGVVTDQSGNGHAGTVSGATWTSDPVHGGGVYSFDGSNDFIRTQDDDTLSFGDGADDAPFTICAWVRRNQDVRSEWLCGKYSDTKAIREYAVWFRNESGGRVAASCADGSTQAYIARKSPDFDSGVWHHVTATYDGNSSSTGIALYLDGVRVDNEDYSLGAYTAMENQTQHFYIGWVDGAASPGFDGLIDDVRIYGRELAEHEILELAGFGGIWAPWLPANAMGWIYVPWFGSINIALDPWIYHLQHGWMCPVGDTVDALWLYTLDMGWIFTGGAIYPTLYCFGGAAWMHYLQGTSNPRWFFNYSTGLWEQH